MHPRQIEVARRFAAECPGQVVTWDFTSEGDEAAFRATEIDPAALRVDDAMPTHNIWDKIYPKELLRDVRFLVGERSPRTWRSRWSSSTNATPSSATFPLR